MREGDCQLLGERGEWRRGNGLEWRGVRWEGRIKEGIKVLRPWCKNVVHERLELLPVPTQPEAVLELQGGQGHRQVQVTSAADFRYHSGLPCGD